VSSGLEARQTVRFIVCARATFTASFFGCDEALVLLQRVFQPEFISNQAFEEMVNYSNDCFLA
jgi:hypothetical protein